MSCGNKNIFRVLEYGLLNNRGCGLRGGYSTHMNDVDYNISLLNKMYVNNQLNDEEYLRYKRLILENRVTFDEIVMMQQNKTHNTNVSRPIRTDKNNDKRIQLTRSRDKISDVLKQIEDSINDLNSEKKKIEMLLEEYIKHNEKKAEETISKKIDLEESIQSLLRRKTSLTENLDEVSQQLKMLEVSELEYEAIKLEEELKNLK